MVCELNNKALFEEGARGEIAGHVNRGKGNRSIRLQAKGSERKYLREDIMQPLQNWKYGRDRIPNRVLSLT